MATDPVFGTTIRVGSGLIPGTFDVSLTAPTNVTTILTGAAAGTQIEEVVFQAVDTTVAGVINVFLFDNSTYHLYDQVLLTAVTSSTTALGFRWVSRYADCFLKDTTWSLRVSQTIVTNQSKVNVTATGWDFT